MEIDLTKYDGHTPGPWLYRGKSDSVHMASDTHPYGEFIFQFHPEGIPCDADSDLITDAPALLAEVVRLRADLAEAVTALEFATDDLGRVTMADTIRAVLAKNGGA